MLEQLAIGALSAVHQDAVAASQQIYGRSPSIPARLHGNRAQKENLRFGVGIFEETGIDQFLTFHISSKFVNFLKIRI